MRGYFDNPLFLRLLTPSSAHRVRDVRFFVDYDAVQTWNGSTSAPGCVYSPTVDRPYYDIADGWHTAALSIDDLVAGVIEARAEGLTPVVSIEGFSYASATPPGDAPFPDPTTTAGYWDYRCGLLGILGRDGPAAGLGAAARRGRRSTSPRASGSSAAPTARRRPAARSARRRSRTAPRRPPASR